METTISPTSRKLLEAAIALPREERRWLRNKAQAHICEETGRTFITEEQFLADLERAFKEVKLAKEGKLKLKTVDEVFALIRKEDKRKRQRRKRKKRRAKA